MNATTTKNLVLAGMLIALGLVLPMATHGLGSGSVILPMHIPALLAGFLLPLPLAVLVGALIPALSTVTTGMPPMFPVLPFMVVELATYAAVSALLYQGLRQNVYVALIGALIGGRITSAVAVWALVSFFAAKLPSPLVFVSGGIMQGIPGLLIQLILIPALIFALQKSKLIGR